MAAFRALIGDLFTSRAHTLVNTVNCVGVMGKGVALEFKKRFPQMFADYLRRCERREVRLGEPFPFLDPSGVLIVNFPTKGHWRSPARLQDIERGLDYLVLHMKDWGVQSIAMPPLGCGNGGLEWSQVGPLIYRKLRNTGVNVEVYAPYGSPRNQLTLEFLAGPAQMTLSGEGRRPDSWNPNWVLLMEILRELQAQPYANPVGRTVFQKICYVLTELGVDTGFNFAKGSYGPFSPEVKTALHHLANRNWLQEATLGRMVSLAPGPQYEKDRARFVDEISRHSEAIEKTVDLFSRVKTTEQAEEVMTVLFASKQLQRERHGERGSEQDLYDYILRWKKSWNEEEKKQALASAIRSLVLLGWMDMQISESLIDVA